MKKLVPENRVYGLDILRAAAITCVMFSHAYTYSSKVVHSSYYRWLIFDGVGMFFVLSGFLIGRILMREITRGSFHFRDLRNFWCRRWMRTLPAYFVVLSFLSVCYYVAHGQWPPYLGRYYTFTQNLAWPHPLFFREAWSLSVEEWFYLTVPFGLYLLLRSDGKKDKGILLWILIVLGVSTSARIIKVNGGDFLTNGRLGEEVLKVVITRMDAIIYGVLGAWLSHFKRTSWLSHKELFMVLGSVLLITCNIITSDFFILYVKYSFMPLAILLMLPWLSELKTGKGILFKAVTFISIISYSMYLTNHMIVQRGVLPIINRGIGLVPEAGGWQAIATVVLFWAITLICSCILYWFVEKPALRWRDRMIKVPKN